MESDYYLQSRSRLLKDFDTMAHRMRKVLLSRYGGQVDAIIQETRREVEALLPELPYIGGRRNPYTTFIVGAAGFLALYRVLKSKGKSVEETGKIIYDGFKTNLDRYPRWLSRLYGRRIFTSSYMKDLRRRAEESQKRQYPGDYVFTVVEGDGREFDYGIDFTECATCKFYHVQGADELSRFLCAPDFLQSEVFGYGLTRTMSLAEGDGKCDFRFKRGGRTRVRIPECLQR